MEPGRRPSGCSGQSAGLGTLGCRRGCLFLDKHGVLDLKEDRRAHMRNSTDRFLWALRETIGRCGWRITLLSKAGHKRASETVEWLAALRSLQYFDQIVFTSERSTRGACRVWPGEMRRFGCRTRAAAHPDFVDCVWYPGGKDDYIAGYRAAFPGKALILVDDGEDILRSARARVSNLRTIHVDPRSTHPAPLAGTHDNARDLLSLVQKLQAMARNTA